MKETMQVLKREFSRTKIFKRFSIDRLSQMALTLHKTSKKDKRRSHACLYLVFINLKHSQSNVYSILLIAKLPSNAAIQDYSSICPELLRQMLCWDEYKLEHTSDFLLLTHRESSASQFFQGHYWGIV